MSSVPGIWRQSQLQGFREGINTLKAQLSEMREHRAQFEIQSMSDDEDLEKKVVKMEQDIAAMMQSPGKEVSSTPMTEEERVQKWLKEVVKLPEYSQLLIQQGFDELDCIRDVTKEDLESMGIDKVGHQRRILKHSALITST